jgi:hypothetical protein
VRVRVTDTAGATDTDSATVTVTNVAPSVNNLASDSPKPEGSPLTVTGTISDPGWLENLTATINWGDGSPVQTIGGTLENVRPDATLTFSVSHTYLDDNATDTYTATICGFDDDTSTCAPLAVTVFNVPPVVGAITAPTGPVQIGSPISTSATFTDAGVLDTHTAVWNWGDSSTSAGTVSEASGSGSVSGTHTYTSADLYTVTLTVTDDDGGSGSSVFEFVIVFDPTKSLAVNAKIASPAGAYIANPAKTGDVFSSAGARYKSGVPSGGTSFQFNAVPLTFNATSYNWAVVTTTGRGYLQGVGLVNSAPGYSFLVSVVDGTPDKYRMKIWNTAMPAIVVYDSQFGAPINAPANIPLLFGSVVLS